MKTIYAGLIAAVLLVSGSTTAVAGYDPVHWAPYDTALEYFWHCTIFQKCEGSKWR